MKFYDELKYRGLIESVTSPEVEEKLNNGGLPRGICTGFSFFFTRGISTTTLSITFQALTTIAANSTTTSLSLNGQTTKLLLSSISSPSAKTL